MVNLRYRVLSRLREAGTPVSGNLMSSELGISRVAVWKHVRELQREGYGIESSPRGYLLVSVPDLLLPGRFPGWESRVHHFDEVDSTMRVARDLARRGTEEGTIVVAERQASGRGRLGRSWLSPSGGIYMTVVTRPSVAPALASRVSLVASVAAATTVSDLFDVDARVKWPNDVLVKGRKVCGILSEMEAESDAVRYVNVGIGMNANTVVDDAFPDSIALLQLVGGQVDRAEVVRECVRRLLQGVANLGSVEVLKSWRQMAETLGREVNILQGDDVVRGTAVDIEESGALVVRTGNGALRVVFAGDCTYEGT